MTEIAFHFNVPDKLLYACRLLRKVYASGAKVVATGEPEVLNNLDQLLWSFSPTDFVPHERHVSGDLIRNEAPILLAESLNACSGYSVLVNLGQDIPLEFERFERFIEVVALGEEDRLAARRRWKHYTDRGYAMKRHDLGMVGEGI
jgi:DNA polymerase-3 subunit chi